MAHVPDTETDLDRMTDAICGRITAGFPIFSTVEAYREDRINLPVPCCLIELVDLEPSPEDDPGTEQLAVISRWEAYVIMGFREAGVKKAVPKLAAAVALLIRGNRWGLKVGPAVPTAIEPDDFTPELDQYEVWRVDWQQIIHIGKSVWTDGETPPSTVLVSFTPEVGPQNEGKYAVITEPTPEAS